MATPIALVGDVTGQVFAYNVSHHNFSADQAQPETTNCVGNHHVASYGPGVATSQADRGHHNELHLKGT